MPQTSAALCAPSAKCHFTYATLGVKAVEEAHQLLKIVNENLSDETKHFLKPQSVENLTAHINNGFPILGALDVQSGKLAGILLITPTKDPSLCQNLDGYKLLDQKNTAVIQCVAVNPEFEGNGLMKALLKHAQRIASHMGMKHLVSKVATEGVSAGKVWPANKGSENGFDKSGFSAEAAGHDPKMGYPVRYWLKSQLQQVANADFPVLNGWDKSGMPLLDFSPDIQPETVHDDPCLRPRALSQPACGHF